MKYPSPHGDKLRALVENDKLPASDRSGVDAAIERYEAWTAENEAIDGAGKELVEPLVASLNRYKTSIDLDFIFDSRSDFLYRQKGQLKLDNTVLEEFLPRLVGRVFSDRLTDRGVGLGPTKGFSQLHFDSNLSNIVAGGGMTVRSKDHDFAVFRSLFIKTSHWKDFRESREEDTHLAYVAAEIKTNLDKTMFQEASATAYDLKLALPHSRYFLLCEWLDMEPVSTAVTAIEEVIVLRKARRLSANVRQRFSTATGRVESRGAFEKHLAEHPFSPEAFRRFLDHVERLLDDGSEDEQSILDRGWF